MLSMLQLNNNQIVAYELLYASSLLIKTQNQLKNPSVFSKKLRKNSRKTNKANKQNNNKQTNKWGLSILLWASPEKVAYIYV